MEDKTGSETGMRREEEEEEEEDPWDFVEPEPEED